MIQELRRKAAYHFSVNWESMRSAYSIYRHIENFLYTITPYVYADYLHLHYLHFHSVWNLSINGMLMNFRTFNLVSITTIYNT